MNGRMTILAICGVLLNVGFGAAALHQSYRAARSEEQAKFAQYRMDAAHWLLARCRDMEIFQMAWLLTHAGTGGEGYQIDYRRAAADTESLAAELVKVSDNGVDHERAAHAKKVARMALALRDECAWVDAECGAGRKLVAVNHVREGDVRRISTNLVFEVAELREAEESRRLHASLDAARQRSGLHAALTVWAVFALLYSVALPLLCRREAAAGAPPAWAPHPLADKLAGFDGETPTPQPTRP